MTTLKIEAVTLKVLNKFTSKAGTAAKDQSELMFIGEYVVEEVFLKARLTLLKLDQIIQNLQPHDPGWGGGDSHMEGTGMFVGNFEFNP